MKIYLENQEQANRCSRHLSSMRGERVVCASTKRIDYPYSIMVKVAEAKQLEAIGIEFSMSLRKSTSKDGKSQKMMSFRLDEELLSPMERVSNKGRLINSLLKEYFVKNGSML